MCMLIEFVKVHENAQNPSQGRIGDAGWDLTAAWKKIEDKYVEYGTGIAVAIPEGHVGLLFPRSSVSSYDLSLANCVGVIDSNYRGEIKLRFKPIARIFSGDWIASVVNLFLRRGGVNITELVSIAAKYEVGDKVGQLLIIPIPELNFRLVKELTTTNRGADGFGSSGK